MKFLATIIIASLYISAASPPSKLKFDEIIIYDMDNPRDKGEHIINSKGQLARVLKQVTLNNATAEGLDTRLFQKSSYGAAEAACFEPHLGIVYYYNKKIVAHFTICMGCNRLVASVDIPAQHQGKVGSGDDVYYTGKGMSRQFKKFLNSLLVKHKFSHQAA